jgi:hypothetical protein
MVVTISKRQRRWSGHKAVNQRSSRSPITALYIVDVGFWRTVWANVLGLVK